MPRVGAGEPLDTARMAVRRRISATYKDLPGGQLLGASFDYTHRLLDFALAAGDERPAAEIAPEGVQAAMPRVAGILDREGLIEREEPGDERRPVSDLTRESPRYPADRAARLQNLARGDSSEEHTSELQSLMRSSYA